MLRSGAVFESEIRTYCTRVCPYNPRRTSVTKQACCSVLSPPKAKYSWSHLDLPTTERKHTTAMAALRSSRVASASAIRSDRDPPAVRQRAQTRWLVGLVALFAEPARAQAPAPPTSCNLVTPDVVLDGAVGVSTSVSAVGYTANSYRGAPLAGPFSYASSRPLGIPRRKAAPSSPSGALSPRAPTTTSSSSA